MAVAFFVFYDRKDGDGTGTLPDFPRLASNAPYRALSAAGLFLGAALFTTTGYTILYVKESIGQSVVFGGIVFALVQLFCSVGRVLTGWLADVLPGVPRVKITAILIAQKPINGALFNL